MALAFIALRDWLGGVSRRRRAAIHVAVGMILMGAAFFKGSFIASRPHGGAGTLESRSFLLLLVVVELIVGAWIASGVYPKLGWHAAMMLFCLFFGYSLLEVAIGAESCNCFGALSIPPIAAMLLDLLVVAALFFARPLASGWLSGGGAFVYGSAVCSLPCSL